MLDCGTYYEYCAVWVDNLLYAGKNGNALFDALTKIGYKLKGVGAPQYHLGGDFKRVTEPEKVLTWGSHTYIKKMLSQYEIMFKEAVPKRDVHAPLEPGDHPELDTSPLLGQHETALYMSMIGAMQWAVALGRIDIFAATMTMSGFRAAPHEGHLVRLKRVYAYLRNYRKTSIKFRTHIPDYSQFKDEEVDWGYVYHPCIEEVPSDAPRAMGKCVRTTSFVDANLMHDYITGRSVTGILHLLNKTPIEWFCKKQNTVESATYGSEFVAARIATEQIMDLRMSLRYLRVPLDGPSWMFGDNLSVIKSSTIPSSTLKKRHNALAYHRVREAIACKIIRFVHIASEHNPADVLSKHMWSREWFALMKPLIFWTWRDDGVPKNNESEGSVTRLSLVIENNGSSQLPVKGIEGKGTRDTRYKKNGTRYSVRSISISGVHGSTSGVRGSNTNGRQYSGDNTRYSMSSTRYLKGGTCPTGHATCPTGHIEANLG
jgi:hypothetical protein